MSLNQTKSKAQHEYEGNDKAPNRQNPNADGTPVKPKGLSPEASRLWDSLVPELSRLGVATGLDSTNLVGLVRWWDCYQKASAALAKIDDFTTLEGFRTLNTTRTAWQAFNAISKEFGLTALSRNGINVATVESDADDFLN